MEIYPSLSIEKYDSLRSQIQSGDILLCSGNSFFSNMIRKATDSVWSHVAFILRLDIIDRIMVLESVESIGVRAVPLSNYIRNYNGSGQGYPGRLLLARHHDFRQKNIINLSKFAVDLLGCPYNKDEILRISARIGMHAFGFPSQGMDTPTGREFICSEYAYLCFKSVGVNIDFNPLGFISPADFARCNRVELLSYMSTEETMITQSVTLNSAMEIA